METEIQNSPYFALYANCIVVKGAKRTAIYDLQREDMFFIANEVAELLDDCKNKSWNDIENSYDPNSLSAIKKVFDELETLEIGFWHQSPDCFPPMDLSWDDPAKITNAIIDIDEGSNHDFQDLFSQFEQLGCLYFQLRYFCPVLPEAIIRIMEMIEGSRIRSVELLLPQTTNLSPGILKNITAKYVRLKSVTVHSADRDEVYRINGGMHSSGPASIFFVRQRIISSHHCGIINELNFAPVSTKLFSESRLHNSCLNRKLSIAADGTIKNCPALNDSYGNVKTTKLESCLGEDFKKWWDITKDQIEICKDCEYRYVCTDCRAFLNDPYAKPAKCGYDPYTLQWNIEKTTA